MSVGPQNIGLPGYRPGDSGNAFEKNPGTRIKLSREDGLTKPGLLKEEFQFPAPPLDELAITGAFSWGDYDTLAAGQFSRPASMQLKTVSFDTIFVADDYWWAFYNPMRKMGWTTQRVAKELDKVMRSGTPVWMVIEEVQNSPNDTGEAAASAWDFGEEPLLRMLATLRTFTHSTRAGEPDARYASVAFTEHRVAGAQERAVGKGTAASGKLPAAITMKDVKGSLHDLATSYYGSASQWTLIKAANPWLGNITATQDLSDQNSSALKTAAKANRRLVMPVLSQGGRA